MPINVIEMFPWEATPIQRKFICELSGFCDPKDAYCLGGIPQIGSEICDRDGNRWVVDDIESVGIGDDKALVTITYQPIAKDAGKLEGEVVMDGEE